eukprot:8624197-Karenia_brevis.AAC.1
MDVVLQPLVKAWNIPPTSLYTPRKYDGMRLNTTRASDPEVIPDILEKICVKVLDVDCFARTVDAADADLGKHARTG